MNPLQLLRLKSILGQDQPIGNDLPSQGGFGGNLPSPHGMLPQMLPPDMPQNPPGMGQAPMPDMASPDFMPPMGQVAPSGPVGPMAQPPTDVAPDSRTSQWMQDLYHPEHGASDRLNTMLGSYPTVQKPSMLRRIAGGVISSRLGPEQGKEFVENAGGRRHKLEDWKNQIGPTTQAAQLENQSNVNERTLAYQTVAQRLKDESQAAKEANDTKRSDIAMYRARIYDFKARHPAVQLIYPKGGNVMYRDPATGEMVDTKVPTGTLDEFEKSELNAIAGVEKTIAAGQQNRLTEEVKQGNRIELLGMKPGQAYIVDDPANPGRNILVQMGPNGAERVKLDGQDVTNATRPGSSTATGANKPLLPSQQIQEENRLAKELANTDPKLAPFIKFNKSGRPTVTPPSTNSGGWGSMFAAKGATPEQFAQINTYIYGNPNGPLPLTGVASHGETTQQPMAPPANAPPSNAPAAPAAPSRLPAPVGTAKNIQPSPGQAGAAPGYTIVKRPDGSLTQVKTGMVSQLPKGYQVQ